MSDLGPAGVDGDSGLGPDLVGTTAGEYTEKMGARQVTDGGLETDLIFLRGVDLPEFAAFPLLDSDEGRAVLADYFMAYVDIAVRAGARVLLETPTWRANPDHAARLGYDAAALDRVNRESVAFLAALAATREDELVGWDVSGMLGPRGDGYASAGPSILMLPWNITGRSSHPSPRRARNGLPCSP